MYYFYLFLINNVICFSFKFFFYNKFILLELYRIILGLYIVYGIRGLD